MPVSGQISLCEHAQHRRRKVLNRGGKVQNIGGGGGGAREGANFSPAVNRSGPPLPISGK